MIKRERLNLCAPSDSPAWWWYIMLPDRLTPKWERCGLSVDSYNYLVWINA